jgi:hypothetical protein
MCVPLKTWSLQLWFCLLSCLSYYGLPYCGLAFCLVAPFSSRLWPSRLYRSMISRATVISFNRKNKGPYSLAFHFHPFTLYPFPAFSFLNDLLHRPITIRLWLFRKVPIQKQTHISHHYPSQPNNIRTTYWIGNRPPPPGFQEKSENYTTSLLMYL